ncbi:uncharacterized protein LOC133335560 [Musca vetustissima]|uniref:uncharacterized protein LOC133335560 n=1 Tax=Musca vetustissima TaxID=27455 RepID=UPI002AB71567|nr:uncharacterized protein LOC133335560 [Musca vetustissima]
MTSTLGFYKKPKVLHSPSFDDDDDDEDGLFANEEDDEYLQEVPYTSSSSIDRGSIGSIPWNDDAIRLNQIEWEKVENMLAGIEDLPTDDDLRKEILDWQKKFPKLMGRKTSPYRIKALSSDTLESLPSLNISSSDEDEMDDDITPTREKVIQHEEPTVAAAFRQTYRKTSDESNDLNSLLKNFTLTTVPLKLNERETMHNPGNKRKCATSSTSSSYSPPTPTNVPIVQPTTSSQHRLRMPPILNVLESTRKFRNLGRHQVNPSFVQLTHVQQAKSAVVTQDQNARSRFNTGHRSAWHVPLAANRFFNNRNSIVLPSLSSSRQQQQQIIHQYNSQPTTISNSSDLNTTTPSSTREHFLRTNNANIYKSSQILASINKRDKFGGPTTTASTQTTNNTSTNSGRSISAAIPTYHPRSTFNVFYLPYSASKFHAFK